MTKDLLPEWIPKEAWTGYCAMRKLKKKPMTPGALTRTINTLERMMQEGQDIALVLNQSEDQGFVGVFPVSDSYRRQRGLVSKPDMWRHGHEKDRGNVRETRGDRADAAIRAKFGNSGDAEPGRKKTT